MYRHRVWIFSSHLLLCALTVRAGTKAAEPAESSPHIQFAEPVYDFGKVKSGELVKHSFIFTNTGSATLAIVDVRPGCGCTTAGTWDKSIEPGKTGSIPLQFNSTGFGGKVTKVATVTSNDPKQSNVVLQITGTVWKPIDLSPTMAMFNFPPEGQTNETRALRIVSNLEEPITLETPVSTNKSFRVELKTITPGKVFELAVTALPPFTAGYSSLPIKIKTSSKEMPEITTSAYVSVMPVFSVFPQVLSIPAGPLPQKVHQTVTIRNNTTNNVTISDPAISIPGASIDVKEIPGNRSYNLTIDLPAGFQAQPGQKLEITAKTTHPKEPMITVPIMQQAALPKPAKAAQLAPVVK